MIVSSHEEIISDDARIRGGNRDLRGHIPLLEVDITATHVLSYFTGSFHNVGNGQTPHRFNRKVETVGFPFLIDLKTTFDLHGIEFTLQFFVALGALFQCTNLFRRDQPLREHRLLAHGIGIQCILIGALRDGAETSMLPPGSLGRLGHNMNSLGSRSHHTGKGCNEARLSCPRVRWKEGGTLHGHLLLLLLFLRIVHRNELFDDEITGGHMGHLILVSRRIQNEEILILFPLEGVGDTEREKTNTVR